MEKQKIHTLDNELLKLDDLLNQEAEPLRRNLRMKCPTCGCWNRFPVNKIIIEQSTSESKVEAYIPMYEPLEVVRCKKCGKIIAEPKELIRIQKTQKKVC